MKYSFIIPTYNKKEPLKKTLQALNNLSGYGRDDYEVVLVDDGSTDEVFGSIKGVNHNYRLNYVYLDRCEDSCRARTRNYGIKLARGRYIVFIDDDIIVRNDYLQELARCFRFSDNLVVTGTRLNCPPHIIDSTDIQELRRTACQGRNIDAMEVRHLVYNTLSYNLSAHKYPWMLTFTSNLAVPRKLLLEIEGFEENFKKWGFEDVELGYRLFKAGAKFVINSKLEAFHQEHPRGPEGENNQAYFQEKCKEVFKDIDPEALLSLFGIGFNSPDDTSPFRKYQGKIHRRAEVEFRKKSELEKVKKRILRLSGKKGSEVIVKDYCENTDLDLWIQMLEVNDAFISYFPQSFRISEGKRFEMMNVLLFVGKESCFR
jgi:glycosyltransferase involved in cell wall biosynthesis